MKKQRSVKPEKTDKKQRGEKNLNEKLENASEQSPKTAEGKKENAEGKETVTDNGTEPFHKDEGTENYQFLSEAVVPSSTPGQVIRGSKVRLAALVLCLAVFFGILASLSYAVTNGIIDYIARKNSDSDRTPVHLGNDENTANQQQAIITDVSKLAESVKGAVVTVKALTESQGGVFSEMLTNSEEFGGVVISDDGSNYLVLTEYESIASASSLSLEFEGGASAEGRIVGYDSDINIAIILVEHKDYYMQDFSGVKVLEFAPAGSVVVGGAVLAIGAPNSIVGSIDYGIVTSTKNQYPLADMCLNVSTAGIRYVKDSSGVIINMEGKICGIISDYYAEKEIFSYISTDGLLPVIEQLANNASLLYTGAVCENIPADILKAAEFENGIYVQRVEEGSPADKAGLRSGDIIISSGDTQMISVQDYTDLIYESGYESKIKLKVKRNNTEKEITVEIGK